MRLCHQTLAHGSSLFEILDDRGGILWSGEHRDQVIELLWASGINIPDRLVESDDDFDVQLSWASARVSQSRADVLGFVDGLLRRSASPGPPGAPAP